MIIRKLDASGDWVYGNGLDDYATRSEAIANNIQTRLYEWRRDCPWALQKGVDWRTFLGSSDDLGIVIDSQVKSVIIASYGVAQLLSYESTKDQFTRKLNIAFTYLDVYSLENRIILNPFL